MSCYTCWPWCKTPPPTPKTQQQIVSQYDESKSIRPQTLAISVQPPAKHGRVLSTMYIKDGKAVVSYKEISDGEANRRFGMPSTRVADTARVRFRDDVVTPTSPMPHSRSLTYQPSMATLAD